MKERGLTFCQALVPAVLEGRKTVTRRLGGLNEINENPDDWRLSGTGPGVEAKTDEQGRWFFYRGYGGTGNVRLIRCPQGVPGDRFYMQEAWGLRYPDLQPFNQPAAFYGAWAKMVEASAGTRRPVAPLIPVYKADAAPQCDGPMENVRWRSGRFQPKWACRPERWELVSIRPERVREITVEDICNEGVEFKPVFLRGVPASLSINEAAYGAWKTCWNNINAARGYAFERNNWVWREQWSPKPVAEKAGE